VSKVSEILSGRKPRTKTVRLVLNGDSQHELELAKNELRNLKLQERIDGKDETLSSKIPTKERQILELEATVVANAVEFTFQAVGRATLERLKALCAPSEAQWLRYREQAKANPSTNPPMFDWESLAPLLIAASATEPTMSEEEALALWDGLSDGESAQLYEAAWGVSNEAASVPLVATGIGGIGSSDESSTTQQVKESLGLSIPDEF